VHAVVAAEGWQATALVGAVALARCLVSSRGRRGGLAFYLEGSLKKDWKVL